MNTTSEFSRQTIAEKSTGNNGDDDDECGVTAAAAVRHDTTSTLDTLCVRRARCGGAASEVVVTTAAAETSPKAVTRVKCHARATHPHPSPFDQGACAQTAALDTRPSTVHPRLPTNFVARVIMIIFTRAPVISICPK